MSRIHLLIIFFVVLIVAFSNVYVLFAQEPSGLIAYYRFDGDPTDQVGTNNGQFMNGSTPESGNWVAGKAGQALEFDGINDYIDFGSGSTFDITGGFTIALWAKGTAANASQAGLLGKSRIEPYGLAIDDGDRVLFRVISGASSYAVIATGLTTSSTTWYHYVGVFEPGQAIRLYRDGVELDSLTTGVPTSVDPSSYALWGGTRAHSTSPGDPTSSYHFDGALDDIAIYNRALTQSEVQWLRDNPGALASTPVDPNWLTSNDIVYTLGKVGIGTSQPDEALTVAGKIHAEEIIVDLNVLQPDFVFEKDYKLPPLEQVEQYIKAKKHLPGIPSAREVTANGVSLGDMQTRLLQKIEELTLYVIDMKKENDLLKQEVASIKAAKGASK